VLHYGALQVNEDAMDATVQRLDVTRAGAAELASIMATERIDGYEQLVGRWSEEHHRTAMADGKHAYFIARLDGEPKGFVIVRDWNSPERVVAVKRIAVTHPGRGYGRALLSQTLDAIFEQTTAYRVWLGVFPDNHRARRAYEAVGFQAEGVARCNALFEGVHRDELVMSILRPEWIKMRRP
jgi:RimJ/RimL family protein N-acetyltransferase